MSEWGASLEYSLEGGILAIDYDGMAAFLVEEANRLLPEGVPFEIRRFPTTVEDPDRDHSRDYGRDPGKPRKVGCIAWYVHSDWLLPSSQRPPQLTPESGGYVLIGSYRSRNGDVETMPEALGTDRISVRRWPIDGATEPSLEGSRMSVGVMAPPTFDYPTALMWLQSGHRLTRVGWNGRGMWIALTPGSEITCDMARSGAAMKRAEELRDVDGEAKRAGRPRPVIIINPHIDMKAADGSIVIGWVASQSDMLANDWKIVW